jgi:hypothetical protein
VTPLVTVNSATVAHWFGVNPSTVSNWFVRFDTTPVPDVVTTGPSRLEYWSWKPERRAEWEKWHKENIGSSTASQSRKRKYTA